MKIMLFSPVCPNGDSSGSIMLRDLCYLVKNDRIYCFIARDPKLRGIEIPKFKALATCKVIKRPIESPYRFPRWFFDRPLSRFIELLKNFYIRQIVLRRAIAFGKKNKVDCLWVILQGKTMINCTLPLARSLKVPIIAQVWDDPEWILTSTGIPESDRKKALLEFEKALEQSEVCATASEQMAKDFGKRYSIPMVAFLGSIDQKMAAPVAKKVHRGEKIKIGFAGQIYTQIEWKALFAALESAKWSITGKKIELHLFGKKEFFNLPKTDFGKIVFCGYRSQKAVIKALAQTDILYCPYWFEAQRKKIGKTSFPSKLATYFASGRPIFFHGQKFTSAAKFLHENNCAKACYSLDKIDIISSLESMLKDKEYTRLARAGRIAFNKNLTYGNLALKLDEFLDKARKEKI